MRAVWKAEKDFTVEIACNRQIVRAYGRRKKDIPVKRLYQVRSGQVRSECLTCTFTESCCSARLSRAQVRAFPGSSVRDRKDITTVSRNVVVYEEGDGLCGGFLVWKNWDTFVMKGSEM